MIVWLHTASNADPVFYYLASMWGQPRHSRLLSLSYEKVLTRRDLPRGGWIFSDIELLSPAQRADAIELKNWLQSSQTAIWILNDPALTLRRTELHHALARENINAFDSFALPLKSEGEPRYPLILRHADSHGGTVIWVKNRAQLDEKCAELCARGADLTQWIATEFCDCSDSDGVFHKASAFCIAGRIVPRHLFFSRHWMVKYADLLDPVYRARENEFLATNPQRAALERIFKLAQVDFGRIDYSVLDGQIQVWEINTNPMVLRPGYAFTGSRAATHRGFARDLERVWRELDPRNQKVPRGWRHSPKMRARELRAWVSEQITLPLRKRRGRRSKPTF